MKFKEIILIGVSLILCAACTTTTPMKTLQYSMKGNTVVEKIEYPDPKKPVLQSQLQFIGFNKDKSKVFLWDSEANIVKVGCLVSGSHYVAC